VLATCDDNHQLSTVDIASLLPYASTQFMLSLCSSRIHLHSLKGLVPRLVNYPRQSRELAIKSTETRFTPRLSFCPCSTGSLLTETQLSILILTPKVTGSTEMVKRKKRDKYASILTPY
jgi:hypothetical protein